MAQSATTIDVDVSAAGLVVQQDESGSWRATYSVGFQAEPGGGATTFHVLLQKYHSGVLVDTLVDQDLTAEGDPQSWCRAGCDIDTCTETCENLIGGVPVSSWCKRWQPCEHTSHEFRCSCKSVSPWTIEVEWAEGDELRLSVEPGVGSHDIDPGNNTMTVRYGD